MKNSPPKAKVGRSNRLGRATFLKSKFADDDAVAAVYRLNSASRPSRNASIPSAVPLEKLELLPGLRSGGER